MEKRTVSFFQAEGMSAVVWNPETDSTLCEFSRRELVTDDPALIAKLEALGYPSKVIAQEEDTAVTAQEEDTAATTTPAEVKVAAPVKGKATKRTRSSE